MNKNNKKIVIMIISLIILATLLVFVFVKDKDNNESDFDKDSYDKYNVLPLIKDEQTLKYINSTKVSSKLIDVSEYDFNSKKLIINTKNNSGITLSYNYVITIYNSDKEVIDTIECTLLAINPDDEATHIFDVFSDEKNITYSIEIDAFKEQEYKSNKNNIVINKIDDGESLLIQLTNNSFETVDFLQANILFYKDNKIVGIDVINKNLIRSNETINEIINYYEKYNITSFDRCEVIINEAISYIGN